MPNKNYLRGRRFEYEVAKELREVYQCDVMRTAGSHGKADLISISPKGDVTFIQCKVVPSEEECLRLEKKFRKSPFLGYRERAKYHQQLTVKINGVSGWYKFTI